MCVVVAGFGLVVPVGSAAAAPVVECALGDTRCDVDGDRIPDDVEEAVCGSVSCATGREDIDDDGLADWVEFQASGDVRKADPRADGDSDGIPDLAEMMVCGSVSCATGREDIDDDGIGDWAEVVICGDFTCADGTEDYNGNGTPDAAELAACVTYGKGEPGVSRVTAQVGRTLGLASDNGAGTRSGVLATTGAQVAFWVMLAGALTGVGVVARVWVARRRAAQVATTGVGVEGEGR